MNWKLPIALLATRSSLLGTAFVPATNVARYHAISATHRAAAALGKNPSNFLVVRSASSSPCDPVTDGPSVGSFVGQKGAAKLLRTAKLTNASGESVQLGDYMGDETSIVVFLRHLG